MTKAPTTLGSPVAATLKEAKKLTAKKRCLMIGAGGFAGGWIRNFLPAFFDRMVIAGLVDIDEGALGASADFLDLPKERRFTEMAKAFETVDADFCIVVIPPAHHKDAVMLAAERGLAILSEKPIADTWEACADIYGAVTAAGLRMQVVQNYRYDSTILTLKKAISEERLGRLNYLTGRFAADYRVRGSWGAFRHEIPHALLVEGSVHHFDQLRNLAGSDCETIAGWEWKTDSPSFDGECCGLYVAKMTNGTVASYEGSCLAAGTQNAWHQEYYRAECESGAVVLDRDCVVRTYEHIGRGRMRVEDVEPARPEYEGHKWIINEFIEWLDGGPEPATVLQDNIKSAAMLFGAVEASRVGHVSVAEKVQRLQTEAIP